MDKDSNKVTGQEIINMEGLAEEKFEKNAVATPDPFPHRHKKYNKIKAVLTCQNPGCGSMDQLRVINMNGFKFVLCRKCIEQKAKEIQKEQQQQSNNIGRFQG